MHKKSELIDFFKSKETAKIFLNEKNEKYIFFKMETDFPEMYALVCAKFQDDLERTFSYTVGLINKNDGEFCYVNNQDYFKSRGLFDYRPDDSILNFSNIRSAIIEEIYNKVKRKMCKSKERILKENDYTDYLISARKCYINKSGLIKPAINFNENIDINFIGKYLFNKKEFMQDLIKKYSMPHNNTFTKYFLMEKAYEEVKLDIENDILFSRKEALSKILKSDSIKNVNVQFKYPNGKIDSFKCTVNNQASELYKENKFIGLNIAGIDKITWHRKVIYDDSSFKELTENDKIKLFVEQNDIRYLSDNCIKDKNLAIYCIEKNKEAVSKVDTMLLKDKTFIKKLFDNENISKVFLEYLPPKVLDDVDYVDYILSPLDKTRQSFIINTIIENADPKIFESFENFERFFHKFKYNKNIYPSIIEKLKPALINSPEFYNFLKYTNEPMNCIFDEDIIKAIKNTETLIRLTTVGKLLDVYSRLDVDKQDDKNLVMYLLENRNINRNFSKYLPILDVFKNDDEMINEIIKYVDNRYIDSIITKFKIDTNNLDKMFELSSLNVCFLKFLSDSDQDVFFEAELLDYADIYIDGDFEDNLYIETFSGAFLISEFDIRFKSNPKYDSGYYVLNQDKYSHYLDLLLNEIKKRDSHFIGNDFDSLLEYVKKQKTRDSKIDER